MSLQAAVAEYLAREAAANRRLEGAQHMAAMDQVARKYGLDVDVLTDAVLRAVYGGGD